MNICPITITKKARIYANIFKKKEELFNLDYIKNYNGEIKNINLCKLLNIETNNTFPCPFIHGNYAWISVSKDGVYRYFTKSRYNVIHGFDVFDLLAIYFNTDFKGVIKELNNLGINYKDKWRESQKNKYDMNISFFGEQLKNYPALSKILGKHNSLFNIFNDFAKENIGTKKLVYNNEAIFFISTTYVRDIYSEKSSISTINQLINLLAVLGLIEKVSDEYIELKKEVNSRCNINYYIIPNVKNVIKIAEERARVLLINKIKYYDIKKTTLIKIFGQDFANKIYEPKVGGGDKKKVSKLCDSERQLLEHIFKVSLIEEGYVSREILLKEVEHLSIKSFEKFWAQITRKYNITKVIPNRRIKKSLRLKTRQAVLFRDIGEYEKYNLIAI